MEKELYLIAHDIRSSHNVGALLRLADGLGVRHVYLTGYTPYPETSQDERLPHIAQKLHKQIQKTALGAEKSVSWSHEPLHEVLAALRLADVRCIALEQGDGAVPIQTWHAPKKVAILLGREVEGIDPKVHALCDQTIEIPMLGKKESHNVTLAAAMALFYCRFVTEAVK